MINKKLMICLLLCFLFIIPVVSAHDDSATDLNATDDNLNYNNQIDNNLLGSGDYSSLGYSDESVLSADGSGNTFQDLKIKIDEHIASGTPLELDKEYTFTPGVDDSLVGGIEITGPITINGNGHTLDAGQNGRIFNLQDSKILLNNITFKNGKSDNGGAILYSKSGIQINNSKFIDNVATASGGAIRADASTYSIKIYNSQFIDNVANEYAGGISIGTNSEVHNCTFKGNNVTSTANNRGTGGALNVRSEGFVTISDCSFEDNFASQKGGAVVCGGANIKNSNFTSNSVGTESVIGSGGAVYIMNKNGLSLTVSDSRFDDNKLINKNGHGSAIATENNAKIQNSNFTNNQAPSQNRAGAVYHSKSLTVEGSLFEDNQGAPNYFNIYNNGGSQSISTTTFKTFAPTLNVEEEGVTDMDIPVSGRFDIGVNNHPFTIKLTADGDEIGDEITVENMNYQGTVSFSEEGVYTLSIKNDDNVVTDGTNKIIIDAPSKDIKIIDDDYTYTRLQELIDNTPEGGTLELPHYYQYTKIVDGTSFPNGVIINKSMTIKGNGNYISGQDKYRIFTITADGVTLDNITFVNGKAKDGGAILVSAEGLEIHNSTFVNNTASGCGGAIRSSEVDLGYKVYDSKFINNTAVEWGGAASAGKDSEFYNCLFEGNNVTTTDPVKGTGAAINARAEGVLKMVSNCTFIDNHASGNGGAIIAGSVTVKDSTFTSNTAGNSNNPGSGAAIYTTESMTITNSTFDNNRLLNPESSGGALYIGTGATIKDSNFTSNNATNGGAIYGNGNVNISNSYFDKNVAQEHGSAIYMDDGKLYISDTEFGKNRAPSSSLVIDVPSESYYPIDVTANITFEGCDNIANAIYNNGSNTNVFVSNVTYEAFINGNHSNKTTPVGYINPEDGTSENAEIWQDTREDSQLINILVTSKDNPDDVIINETGLLTDVYGNITKVLKDLAPGEYTIVAEHISDDYYTGIKSTADFTVYDLQVNKTTDDVEVLVEENVTYTIPIANLGPKNLSDIKIIECVPDGFVLIDYSDDWEIISRDGNNITFRYIGNNGILEGNSNIALVLTFNATKDGKFNNTVFLSSNETSLRQANSSNETTVHPYCNLTVDKTHNVTGTAYVDDLIEFIINVTNDGPSVATDINVTDILDGAFEIIEVRNGTYVSYRDDHKVVWVIPSLAKSQSTYVSLLVKVTKAGTFNNTATVESPISETVNDTVNVTAEEIPTNITLTNITAHAGDEIDIPINVSDDAGIPFNGTVVITLPDGTNKTVEIVNGTGNTSWTIPKDYVPGNYSYSVKYDGDYKYLPSQATGNINVLKVPVDIIVADIEGKPGETVPIIINVVPDDGSIFNDNVTVKLPDGTEVTVEIVNGTGNTSWTIPKGFAPGNYTYSVEFGGDEKYLPSQAEANATVNKVPVDIIVGDVNGKPGERVSIPIQVVPEDGSVFNGYVTVKLPDGTKKVVKITNGKGNVDWMIPKDYKGDYKVAVSFDGDDYYCPANGTGSIHVTPDNPDNNNTDNSTDDNHTDSPKTVLQAHPTANPIFLFLLSLILGTLTLRKRKY